MKPVASVAGASVVPRTNKDGNAKISDEACVGVDVSSGDRRLVQPPGNRNQVIGPASRINTVV